MLRAAAVFSDHMVLQREMPVAVFGEADDEVTVTLAGATAQAEVRDGRFLAVLPPMPAGGPHELALTCGMERIAFRDVMVGEVWLCGGQSNMEFRLRDDADGVNAVACGDDPMLRFYTVNQEARVDDAMLARERESRWKALSPGTCGDVSAVAHYAGLRLREALGVPVGMLICCVGGSLADQWISRETLEAFPEGRARLEAFEALVAGKPDAQFEAEDRDYQARVDAWVVASDWLKAERPGIRAAEIAAAIGDFPWPPPEGRGMMRRPGNLWTTMVRRIIPYTARGLFWYQGESDATIPDGYDVRFARLIREWRAGFDNEDLWVIAAQLPGFGADPALEDWPAIRAAQQAVCDDMDRCALACLLDCGERDDIHPWDKCAPGRRLADLALNRAYGLPVDADAPRLSGAACVEGGVRLTFTEEVVLRGDARSLTVNGEPAKVEAVDGGIVVAASMSGVVRYGRENDPAACLFGTGGLPVLPFEVEV